jgi:hypothetical protein
LAIRRLTGVEISTGAMTVTSTAQTIETGFADPYRLILRDNSATVGVYFGASSVTTSTGFPLKVGEAYEVPVRVSDGKLYMVCAEGQTVDLRWAAVL